MKILRKKGRNAYYEEVSTFRLSPLEADEILKGFPNVEAYITNDWAGCYVSLNSNSPTDLEEALQALRASQRDTNPSPGPPPKPRVEISRGSKT